MIEVAFFRSFSFRPICKNGISSRHFDQFTHPFYRTDRRLVPFFKIHPGTKAPFLSFFCLLKKRSSKSIQQLFCFFLSSYQTTHHFQDAKNILDGSLVGDKDLKIFCNEFSCQFCLYIRKSNHKIRIERLNLFDASSDIGRNYGLFLFGSFGPLCIGTDPNQSVLLSQKVEPFGGFFGKGYDSLRSSHKSMAFERQVSSSAALKEKRSDKCYQIALH